MYGHHHLHRAHHDGARCCEEDLVHPHQGGHHAHHEHGGRGRSGHGHAGHCRGRAGGAGRGALVEPAALAALLRAGAHGYDLRRAIGDVTGGAIGVDPGGLYRVLRRLEDEGFVTSSWVEGESGPQKRTYELTAEGRELAEEWSRHLRERERTAGVLAAAIEGGLTEGGGA